MPEISGNTKLPGSQMRRPWAMQAPDPTAGNADEAPGDPGIDMNQG